MSVYQTLPDTYSVPVKSSINKASSNSRYKNFTQTHFTAGDEEQFYHYMVKNSPSLLTQEELLDNHDVWSKYNISPDAIKNTFSYMFYKFKKGLFVQIRNGKLVRFLPFSNAFYINEWSDRLRVPDKLLEDNSVLPVRYWYANNGLVRYESPCNETDTGMCQMKHMFEQVCASGVPDIDLFINRRDFPLLKRDSTEPYENMYDSDTVPLLSHNYEEYIPVLSMCTNKSFADIPIPTMDDWTRVMSKENVNFAMTKRVIATKDTFDVPWTKKKDMAVFRGSNTGIGHADFNNVRIKLCSMFQSHPYCNVGITSWNSRYRKLCGNPNLLKPVQSIQLSNSLTLEEQSTYKYIIHVQGHTQAFRLSIELAMRSVILLVQGKYSLWYESKLEPWVHYIPVSEDLSDLDERIQWCLEHDSECELIAKQARAFYDEYLTKNGCLTYLKNLICELSQKCMRKYYPLYQTCINPYKIELSYLKQYPLTNMTSTFANGRTITALKTLGGRINKSDRRRKVIFRNANTEIFIVNDDYIIKRSTKTAHEKFVGLYCINRLLRDIPNFVYTVPTQDNDTCLALEYVRGPTMFEYIKGKYFNFNEWLFFTMQVLLSISVAQRVCFFTHNDLNIWNIILAYHSSEQIHDYLIDLNRIYRVYTTVVPVLIDFDKTHVVYDLQSFTPYLPYDSYHDTLCLLINSMYNVLKYQKLSSFDERNMLFIFRETLCDSIYCPRETINSIHDVRKFLDTAHKFAHISFSNKGQLKTRTPMHAFKILKTLYKPTYIGQSKIINIIDSVQTVEYRNLGIMKTPTQVPVGIHPFLELYYKQLFYDPQIQRSDSDTYTLDRINIPLVSTEESVGIYDFPSKYLDYINIFIELLSNGGGHQLTHHEKDKLLQSVQNHLNTRESIYIYSKHLINFKLQRNIL